MISNPLNEDFSIMSSTVWKGEMPGYASMIGLVPVIESQSCIFRSKCPLDEPRMTTSFCPRFSTYARQSDHKSRLSKS